MERLWLGIGSAAAFLGVAAGAFAAHELRGRLSDAALGAFETATRYQVYHALALVLVSLLVTRGSVGLTNLAGGLFVAGIILFSGSLYLLALSNVKWLGAVTPLGGLCFLAGWALLLLSAMRG
ncbi:MAG TPA: DUF423 domain-containing protein [Dehalococcoidia bacterium]|nr:DUF423 domain-containing protein [Dehalococcoidia bacterium]